LPARVERTRDLRAAERSVVEQAAVFARKRHALRDALVDDVHRELREPVDVGLARTVVAAFDGVVEQPLHAVAVVLVVLGGVDAALRGDAVRAAGAVVDAEAVDVVAELAERGRRRRARQARADDDDVELPLVGRVDQLDLELVPAPFVGQRPRGDLRLEGHTRAPKYTQTGIDRKPTAMTRARVQPIVRIFDDHPGGSTPSDWNALDVPCHRWKPTMI